MKKLTVLGIEFKDYSVRESMRRITMYLNNGICNTVDFITHDVLLKASADESMKEDLENMDLLIPTNNDILQAGNVSSRSRGREIESNLFLKGLLRKISKEGRGVFLISQTKQKLDALQESLTGFYGPLNIVYAASREDTAGGDDSIVNEVNSSLPDVIMMNLESPDAERFIRENRMKLNAQLIVVIRDVSLRVNSRGAVKKGGLSEFLMRRLFKNALNTYDRESASADSSENRKMEEFPDPEKIIEFGNKVSLGDNSDEKPDEEADENRNESPDDGAD